MGEPCHSPIEVNILWKPAAGRNLPFSQARSHKSILISGLQLNYDKLFQGDRLWDLQIYNQKKIKAQIKLQGVQNVLLYFISLYRITIGLDQHII